MYHLLQYADGRTAVMTLLDPNASIEAEVAKMIESGFKIVSHHEISADAIPSDRTFRDSWRHCESNGVRHCMDTARNIHRDRIRARRKERFAETDAVQLIGVSTRRDTSEVAAMAQGLRDATRHPSIDEAQTVEELKSAWPGVLEQTVPALGGLLATDGSAPAYDTKALEAWANGLSEQIEKLAETRAETARDLQLVAKHLDGVINEFGSIKERLAKAETSAAKASDDAAYALKHGVDIDRLGLKEQVQ